MRVFGDAVRANRRIHGDRNRSGEQDTGERAKECLLGPEHERDGVSRGDAALRERSRDLPRAIPEPAIRDRALLVGVFVEKDVRAIRRGPDMPLERLEQRGRRGGRGARSADRRPRVRRAVPHRRCSHAQRRDELSRGLRGCDCGIRKTDAEPALDAQQQFDALEAADPEVALERAVSRDGYGGCGSPKLFDERADDLQHPALDRVRARCNVNRRSRVHCG